MSVARIAFDTLMVGAWLVTGLFVWLAYADGEFFRSRWRTSKAALLFSVLGPISALAFVIRP